MVVAVLSLAAIGAGIFLISSGYRPTPPETAPTPSATFSGDVDAPLEVAATPYPGLRDDQRQIPDGITEKTMAPNHLLIPALDVYASFFSAGLDDGSFELSDDPGVLSQCDCSAAPDATQGSVLMAGHVVYNGVQGALFDLYLARPGMVLYVSDYAGRVWTWKASSLTYYLKEALPPDLFAPTGPNVLNLVTCGGELERRDGQWTYDSNVVLQAVRVGEVDAGGP